MVDSSLAPIERAALAILPLLIEASNLMHPIAYQERDADHAIDRVLDSIIDAAEIVGHRLRKRGIWHGGKAAADLAARLDAATADLDAITRAMDATEDDV